MTDSGGDPIEAKQTTILDVIVEPDTVAPGDTATFTCVIEDSLDERFRFRWADIDNGNMLDGKREETEYTITYITEDKSTRWIAPDSVGHLISFEVEANNGSKDSVSVYHSFSIRIESK